MKIRQYLFAATIIVSATMPAFSAPAKAKSTPITRHTNSADFKRALLKAVNSRNLSTVRAAFTSSPRYYGRQISGKTLDNMINTFVFGCVRKYGGWQFQLELLDGKKVFYASEKLQPGEVDEGGEGDYSSLWILKRVNDKYWRVAEITHM